MKLKTIKNHYYDGYKEVGTIYMADKDHSAKAIRLGLCEEVELPKKPEVKKQTVKGSDLVKVVNKTTKRRKK